MGVTPQPTDSRCAVRRRWCRHTGDQGPGACPRQTDGRFSASGVSAVAGPRAHPIREKRWSLCLPALAGEAFFSVPCCYFITSGLSGEAFSTAEICICRVWGYPGFVAGDMGYATDGDRHRHNSYAPLKSSENFPGTTLINASIVSASVRSRYDIRCCDREA
jgi:hypothetical protein